MAAEIYHSKNRCDLHNIALNIWKNYSSLAHSDGKRNAFTHFCNPSNNK